MGEKMKLLTKEQLNNVLKEYYVQHFGANDTDEWYEQPAVNVWVFQRDGKYISLKAHILTGEVEEFIETK